MARPAGFARNIPAGSFTYFAYCCRSMHRRINKRGSRNRLLPSGKSSGRRRWRFRLQDVSACLQRAGAQRAALSAFFEVLIDPYDREAAVEKSESEFANITVPTYTGSGWYAYSYKTHLCGAQSWFRNINPPHKKLLLAGPAHLDRPVQALREEMLRWYDQWLKGIETGILHDPPVRFWVMGANEWRSGSDWPLPETQWIAFYLRGWERLTTDRSRRRAPTTTRLLTCSCRCRRARPTASRGCAISASRSQKRSPLPGRACSISTPPSTRTIPTGS